MSLQDPNIISPQSTPDSRQSIIINKKRPFCKKKMFEILAFYVSLLSIIIIGFQLACAYPSIPAEQSQCIVDWYPKNDGPYYGRTQRLTGPCENFNVECFHGITLPLIAPPEGVGFLGKVIQGCPDRM